MRPFLVVSLVVALGVVGCRSGFSESACTGEELSLPEAMLGAYDYAELRETSGHGQDAKTRVLTSAGAPCKTARDTAACSASLGRAAASSGFSNGSDGRMPGFHYLVVTRGDEVRVVNGRELTVGAALVPIDSPSKAAAAAAVDRGMPPQCHGSVRRANGAFEVHLTRSSCRGPRDEVVRVTPDGRVEVVSSASKPATCVGLLEAPPRARTGTPG